VKNELRNKQNFLAILLKLNKRKYYSFHWHDIMTLSITGLPFQGRSEKLRKATLSVVISVCPSVRPSVRKEQLGLH